LKLPFPEDQKKGAALWCPTEIACFVLATNHPRSVP
jgi:hypothetical protein